MLFPAQLLHFKVHQSNLFRFLWRAFLSSNRSTLPPNLVSSANLLRSSIEILNRKFLWWLLGCKQEKEIDSCLGVENNLPRTESGSQSGDFLHFISIIMLFRILSCSNQSFSANNIKAVWHLFMQNCPTHTGTSFWWWLVLRKILSRSRTDVQK